MSKWTIYSKDGSVRHESVTEYNDDGTVVFSAAPEYYGTWMGDCFVTMNVKSAYPINFHIGDYVIYRDEKFVLNYDPSLIKKARRGTYGEGFTYDSIKFNALHYELTDIRFLDYVLAGNDLHWSSLPYFPFYAASIDDFCDRLQANTNRYCQENGFEQDDYWVFLTPSTDNNGNPVRSIQRLTTSGFTEAKVRELWTQAYGSGVNVDDEKKDVNVTISDQSVWNSMTMIKNNFGLNFIVRGRHVIIGAAGVPTNKVFKYGKSGRSEGLEDECGLYEIERTADSEQQIITKLFGYGTDKNLPPRFYANIGKICYAYMYSRTADYNVIYLNIEWKDSYFTGNADKDDKYDIKVSFNGTNYDLKAYTYQVGTRYLIGIDTPYALNRQLTKDTPLTILSGVDVDKWPPEYSYVPQNLPTNMAVNRLMLPGFPSQSLYEWVKAHEDCTAHDDTTGQATWRGYTAIFSQEQHNPYVISLNAAELGIREGIKTFDGSNDEEEIYPTIENTGADYIVSAEVIKDNGVSEEEPDLFTVLLPSFDDSFDLSEQMSQGNSPTISVKDGLCGGRTFTIESAKQQSDGTWQCKVHREYDDLLQLWFPYNYGADSGDTAEAGTPYQLTSGDKYVLTGIPMTAYYINASAVKLLEATLKFLSKNDYTRYTYLPKVDEIFMARQHEEYIHGDTSRSLHDTLKEGDIMLFDDADLLIEGSVFIDTLTIKEDGNNGIPTYEVVLRNDKQVGSIQRLQEQINSLANGGGSAIGSGGKASATQAESYIEAYGSNLFLSRQKSDTANGIITFAKGLISRGDAVINGLLTAYNAVMNTIKSTNYSGSGMADTGWSITNDNGSGSSEAVVDYLTIRKKMTINSLEIKETTFSAGDIAQTCASAEIVRTDYYEVDEHGGRTLLGYSDIKSPWWLRGAVLLLGKNKAWGKYGIFSRYKKVRISLTMNELARCNRIRCYFLAKDGDRNIENWWRTNDLARCQTWNITGQTRQTYEPDWDTKTVGNVYWWRKIHDVSWNTGEPRYVMKDAAGNPVPAGNNYENTTTNPNNPDVYANEANIKRLATNGTYSNSVDEAHAPVEIDGKTYHWFEVDYGYAAEQAGATGWCDYKSDLPAAGDKVVQFGNTTDPDRMNVTISEINGSGNPDAPAIKMFRGIYTFDINLSWWGNVHQPPIKISPATGIHLFAPSFEWGTEYGTAKQIIERQEGYWSSIALEYDDNSRFHPIPSDPDEDTFYPKYSDDITNEEGKFISRGGFVIVNGQPVYGNADRPIPKNYVRKCRYYDRISHNGSSWLCVIAEQKYWRVKQGESITAGGTTYNSFDRIPTDIAILAQNKDKTEYVRSYTFDEPTPASNDWMEQVQKGGFKSRVFLRSNIQPQTPSNLTPAGTEYNTYDNPVPPPTEIMDEEGQVIRTETWTDGIPQGSERIWSSTCWFYSPGKHSNWTTPASETDNEKFDVEFSNDYNQPNVPYSGSNFTPDKRGDGTAYGTDAEKNKRANGSGEEANWYDPEADKDNTHAEWDKMIWRAERRIANGEYAGTWAITRIKGEAGATPITAYRWYKDDGIGETAPLAPSGEGSASQEPVAADHKDDGKAVPADKWNKNAPNRPADGWTLFMTQSQVFDDGTYAAWSTPIQISGSTGAPGIDSSDQEWIYILKPAEYTFPSAELPENINTGEVNPSGAAGDVTQDKQQNGWVPLGWYDHAQGVDKDHTILYASFRRKPAGHAQTWDDFQTPIIWSHWGRNGMDGDGVEYVYIRTKNNVAPVFGVNDGGSATDYKQEEWLPYINNKGTGAGQADAESSRCTDDPKGTERNWPYEWMAKRTMGEPDADTGVREWKSYYECTKEGSGASETHKMSLWGNHAENVMRLDISNEMDMVPTDSQCAVTDTRVVATIVRLFDGASEVTLGEVTVSGGPVTSDSDPDKIADYSQTQSGKGRRLAWRFLKDKTMADSYAITINYTYLDIPYEAVFTVAASKGQPIFQLKPSMSSIPFARNPENNVLTPSDRKIGIEIEKIDGINSRTYSSTSDTGVVVRYSFDEMPANGNDGESWTSGEITVANTRDNLFIAMFKGIDGPLLDRESIPVIRDGAHGDGIVSVTRTWAVSAYSTPGRDREYPADIDNVPAGTDPWSAESPAVTAEKPYLWAKETTDYKFQTDVVKYYYIGRRGDNGIDAKDAEWVYVRTQEPVAPEVPSTGNYSEESQGYNSDDHKPYVCVPKAYHIKGDNGSEGTVSGDYKYVKCTDDPQGVDDTWKYEWELKRTKGGIKADNSRDWLPYSGTMVLYNNLSESTLVIDIDNDNDQFGTDSEGVINNPQRKETKVTMYYGTEKQVFISTPKATLKYDDGTPASGNVDITVAAVSVTKVTDDNKEYKVVVDISATPSGTANPPFKTHNGLYVDIEGTCAKGGPKTIRFSLERLMSGERGRDAIIYQLEPSRRSFAFGRDASNNLVAKNNSVQANLKITQGNNSDIYNNPENIPAGLTVPTLSWGFENEATPAAGHSGLPIGTPITITPSDVTTASGMHTCVWLLLSTGDREEIPIIVDGSNGTSPWIADLDNEMDSVACDADGRPVQLNNANQSVSTNFKLFFGSKEEKFYISSVSPSGRDGVRIAKSPTTAANAATSGYLTVTYEGDPTNTRATINGKDEFAVTLKDENNTVTRNLTFTVNGIKPGPDGKTPSVYNLLPSVSEILVGRTGEASDIEFVPTQVATDMWDDFIINSNTASNG